MSPADDEPAAHSDLLRVLVVDDHVFLAEMLALELRESGCDAEPLGGPASLAEVLESARRLRPDVVLLDYSLGDALGPSLGLIGPLRALGAAVVMLTGITDDIQRAACLEAGALGVLAKSVDLSTVLDAVDRAARGEGVQPVAERNAMLDALRHARRDESSRLAPFAQLTPRECEVLAALMEGKSAADIAAESVVSLATVRSQIRAILQKLGVTSQLSAVALANRAGWTMGRDTGAGGPGSAPPPPTRSGTA